MSDTPPHHASCVAVDGDAVLILGSTGAGKSSLALELLALGAVLVADDRVLLEAHNATLIATCPPTLRGLIEARGVGILNAQTVRRACVSLAVDLDKVETERIPPRREVTILGCDIPLLHKPDGIHLPPAILQWMRAGRSER